MTPSPVSIVVVSRARADMLTRCLVGISQLQYPSVEVIVVADPAGLAAVAELPFADAIKTVAYDVPNISAARNLGVAHAAGDVVAFIDDDAVPEPTWLQHLAAPAVQSDVAAMGGYVRARNGISFQWTASVLDRFGTATPLDVDPERATVLHPPQGRAIKTEGTNMAFRRDVLIDLGGFDPAFYYFLDETDLNLRLARAGHATAIVPLAQVHHGFAGNAVRHASRVPKDLFEIGASWAVFQRKHLAQGERPAHWKEQRKHQRQRLLRHMVTGALEPRDVRRLIKRLDAGYAQGKTRAISPTQLPKHPVAAFHPFPTKTRPARLIATRPTRFRTDFEQAVQSVKEGENITILNLSPSSLFHKVSFDARGVWVQRGGLFGKSDRAQPLTRMTTRSRRIEKERQRVARVRGLEDE